jgi:hypothetical protein
MDPDQDLLEKLDRREGLSGSFPIALGIAISALAGAVAYLTLKTEWDGPPDAAVGVAMLVLIGCVTLLTICLARFD